MATIIRDDQVRREMRKVLELNPPLAYLGDGNSPSYLYDPDIPGNVWVQLQTSNGRGTKVSVRGPADSSVPLTIGTAVYLLFDDEDRLYVARQAISAQAAAGTNAMATRTQGNGSSVNQQDIATLAVIPGSPALSVSVKAWVPIVSNTAYLFPGVADIDISGFVPSTGDMCYIVVFVKSDYATCEVFASTARSMLDLPLDVADIQECIDAATVGSTPVWAIALMDDQAAVTYENITSAPSRDLRNFVNTGAGGGSFTDFIVTADSGTPQTISDGDTLTIAGGTGLTSVASATDTVTLNLDNTAVTPASYTNMSATVDQQGRITAASNGATPAPVGAKYIVQTADATLTNEQALGALATGLMLSTTTTGVVSTVAAPSGAVVGDTDAQVLTNKTIDGDVNTLQDIALASIKTVGANTKRFITRDASGVISDATSPAFDNAQHTHANAANGGQLTDAALSAAVGIAKGGTGQVTQTAAMDALSPTSTKGDLLIDNGTNVVAVGVGSAGQSLTAIPGAASGLGYLTAANEGFMRNGKLDVSVASNNLTVALKTLAGTDPSTTDPVYVRIGNTDRAITAALSITRAAGTNWCALGGATIATLEQDLFVYLGYNATDGVVIGFSRMPYGRVYGDFSATTTNFRHAAISTITNATATDEYEVVGRFNAILSATAAFNWSLPATQVIINRPIFETRRLTFTSAITPQTGSLTTVSSVCSYQLVGSVYFIYVAVTITAAGTGGGTLVATTPINPIAGATVPGRETAVIGVILLAASNGATLNIVKYDNTTPIATGHILVVSGNMPLI
jgi:hypothetical protein